MVWVVQITSYEDDYKHRYDNGVYPHEPEIFNTREEAEKYLASELFDIINDYISSTEKDEDNLFSGPDDDDRMYFEMRDNHYPRLKEIYKYDLNAMEKFDYMFDGEFVGKTLTYDIYEKKPRTL